MSEHIHTACDGRGARDVFVNGNKVELAVYADTKKGIVRFHPRPARVAKNGQELYTRELRGKVEVVSL